jgi:predicted naringenin-chalcone synthase
MSLRVSGIGTAVPTYSISQPDAAEAWASLTGVEGKRARTVKALYRKSRIRKRHSTLLEGTPQGGVPRQTFYEPSRGENDPGPTTQARMLRFEADAPGLAAQAARSALEKSGIPSEEITHLVTVSCTGFFAPGPDTALVDQLGLPPTVERTHVGFMGCHGSLNGLRVASSFTGSQPGARVLVASVELCTLHMTYEWDPDSLVANSLFGDGAAALVGVREDGGPSESSWQLAASGTCRLPDSADAMTWRIGDHGFRMTLAATVPDIIRGHLGGWVEGWLEENGLARSDVATWAIHPGGPRILTSVAEALELDPRENATSREVLSEFGNMSSATILFILDRLRRQEAPLPLVAMAFGPGLVVEAALFL